MLFGAALFALGVLAVALADRIRGLRVSRDMAPPRERAPRAPSVSAQPVETAELLRSTLPKPPRAPRAEPKVASAEDDVIAALVTAGYKKSIATEAAWACSPAERTTVERWTAAALRCAHGGMS
jgi:hypothetical protein